MAKRDLKLNSLSRYTKASPTFVLEEHSHCEVPAGCGGVVLRWTDPRRAAPMALWLFTAGEAMICLDGAAPKSGRPMIEFGDHIIAFAMSGFAAKSALLVFAGVLGDGEATHTSVSRKTGATLYVLSSDDGSWKYTNDEPQDDSWMRPGYDDSNWRPMVRRALPAESEESRNSYRAKKATEFGGIPLGISRRADRVWIRKAFSLNRS
jgi:hypothetical protein